jgi:nitroimidazol reductase NimA-like FMN-containing flavoprotein (pyridoxamine 5'-phosphate oxidase superfamily)
MPRSLSEHERQEFFAEPYIGVLSVASDTDRPPLTIPLWYNYQSGGNITIFTGTQGRPARKTRLIERAGVVSLCVQRENFPYTYVTVEGAVVQADRRRQRSRCSRLSVGICRRSTPADAPTRLAYGPRRSGTARSST